MGMASVFEPGPPAGGTVWGKLGGVDLLEEVCHLGRFEKSVFFPRLGKTHRSQSSAGMEK